MNNKKNIIALAVVLVIAIGGATLAYRILAPKIEGQTPPPAPEGGKTTTAADRPQESEDRQLAPDFTVVNWEGEEVRLSDLKGTPVVLNFWASWCPPCKQEMPHFDKIAAEVGEEAAFMMVDLLGLNGETEERGRAYIEEQGYTFPVYFDTSQEAGVLYGVAAIPTTLFIDKDGYVVTATQGMLSEKSLRQGLALIGVGEEP